MSPTLFHDHYTHPASLEAGKPIPEMWEMGGKDDWTVDYHRNGRYLMVLVVVLFILSRFFA